MDAEDFARRSRADASLFPRESIVNIAKTARRGIKNKDGSEWVPTDPNEEQNKVFKVVMCRSIECLKAQCYSKNAQVVVQV